MPGDHLQAAPGCSKLIRGGAQGRNPTRALLCGARRRAGRRAGIQLSLNYDLLRVQLPATGRALGDSKPDPGPGVIVMPSGAVLEGRGRPPNPKALACLVSRDSELAYLLRSFD